MPAWEGRGIEKNADKLTRPFESPLASGHFVFSHGHLLENAGHEDNEKNFSWEELMMSYMYWKKGYTIYAPSETLIYHNYDRDYRPQFDKDKQEILQWNPHLRSKDGTYFKNSKSMRQKIFYDPEFRKYMNEKWGVDLPRIILNSQQPSKFDKQIMIS